MCAVEFEDVMLPVEDHMRLFNYLSCEINFTVFMFETNSFQLWHGFTGIYL